MLGIGGLGTGGLGTMERRHIVIVNPMQDVRRGEAINKASDQEEFNASDRETMNKASD